MQKLKVQKIGYLLLIVITIPLGLATRQYGYCLPHVIATFGGDVLYATLVFFLIRFAALKPPLLTIAFLAWLFCIMIETLQLYRAPWIQELRHTFPFGLILGYGFLWSDWICYAAGVLLALAVSFCAERIIERKAAKRH